MKTNKYLKIAEFFEQNNQKTLANKFRAKMNKAESLPIEQQKKVDKVHFNKIFGQEIEPTHKILQDGSDEVIFQGSKRQCQSFINKQDLVTLYIKEINE